MKTARSCQLVFRCVWPQSFAPGNSMEERIVGSIPMGRSCIVSFAFTLHGSVQISGYQNRPREAGARYRFSVWAARLHTRQILP